MAGPGRNKPGGHKGCAIGRIRDEVKEGGETADQPEHGIWPGARAMYGLLAVKPRRTGEVGANVERTGSSGTHKNHKVLVAKIRRGHGVPPCSVSHAPPSLHVVLTGGLQQLRV